MFPLAGVMKTSLYSPSRVRRSEKLASPFSKDNEATFLMNLWACLLNNMREVEKLEVQGKIEWIKTAWDTGMIPS